MKTREWGGVVCDNERSRSNVHSWLKVIVPDAWGLPLKADVLEDINTGRELGMRALYRRPDGKLMEVQRRRGSGRTVTLSTKAATPSILKDYRPPADQSASEGSDAAQVVQQPRDALNPPSQETTP